MKKTLNIGPSSEAALDLLNTQGLTVETHSNADVPVLPPDITELDDEDIIRLFQHINEFTKFVKYQAALAQIDENNAKKDMEWKEAVASSKATGAKTVTAIKAAAAVDPDVVSATAKYQALYDYRKVLDVMVSNLESDMNLVSRELTRRTSGGTFRSRGSKFTV